MYIYTHNICIHIIYIIYAHKLPLSTAVVLSPLLAAGVLEISAGAMDRGGW